MMPAPVLFLETQSGHDDEVSEEIAFETINCFIRTLKQLRKVNARIGFHTGNSLAGCEVAPNLTLQKLLSGALHQDTWLFLKDLNTKIPFSSEFDRCIKESELSEAKTLYGQASHALNWARMLETGTISFCGRVVWKSAWVEAVCASINSVGDLVESKLNIRNASQREHVDEHGDWLKSLGEEKYPSASHLWDDRVNRFPGLRFLEQVKKQFEDLATAGAPYQRALAQLKTLSDDALKWGGRGSPSFSIKEADGEHDKRRALSRFADEVTGLEHEFDRHVYFTGGLHGRIHFRLSESEKKFVVGYVGMKL